MASRIALYIPSLDGGGIPRVFTQLARGFAAKGHAVDLLLAYRQGPRPRRRRLPPSVRVVAFRAAHVALTGPALVRYLLKSRPGVLFSAPVNVSLVALAAARVAGGFTRVVPTEHSVFSQTLRRPQGLKARLVNAVARRAYPCADPVVTVSEGAARDLAACTGLSRGRIAVIYNPVAGPDQSEAASRAPVEQAAGPVVLAAGRMVWEKDFATLLRAFARLRRRRSARLVLLGDGPRREALGRLARRLGLGSDVAFPGFVEDPYPHMQAASVLAVSSRSEAFGNVLVEAMACGTPVVSTDCPGGPSEILQNGACGPLAPVGDPAALAQALAQALDDPVPAAALKARAADFRPERAVEQYLALVPA